LDDVLETVDGTVVIREGLPVYIVDGHHRHAATGAVRGQEGAENDWARGNIEVFVTMRSDGTAMLPVELMKNSKLLNNYTSNALPCNSFVDNLEALIQYAPTFDASYDVSFMDARVMDLRSDLQSADFLGGMETTTYNRYIRVARLCLSCPGLFDTIIRLNNTEPLPGCKSVTGLSVRALADPQLDPLQPYQRLFCVEGAWYALNQAPKAKQQRKQEFNPATFYAYSTEALRMLEEFRSTFADRCADLSQLLGTMVKITVDSEQTARQFLMSQCRLFVDSLSTTSPERTRSDNIKRIDRAIKKLREKLFPDEASATASKGRIGEGVNNKDKDKDDVIDVHGNYEIVPARPVRKKDKPVTFDVDEDLPTRPSKRQKTSQRKAKGGTSIRTTGGAPNEDGEKNTKDEKGKKSKTKPKPRLRVVPKPLEYENDPFNNVVPTEPPSSMEQRAQVVDGRPEPVIGEDQLISVRLSETLRLERNPTRAFQGRVLSQAGPSTAPPALVNCDEDDPNPYLRIGHIPRTHYAKWFFDATQVRYIRNLAWL